MSSRPLSWEPSADDAVGEAGDEPQAEMERNRPTLRAQANRDRRKQSSGTPPGVRGACQSDAPYMPGLVIGVTVTFRYQTLP